MNDSAGFRLSNPYSPANNFNLSHGLRFSSSAKVAFNS